jgi:DNA-binding MarR family transcriptional regulator
MHRLVASHAPEFTEVNVTMAQAKVLYVVMAAGRLRMSELAARLGIGSSSASELADRLVEMDLLERHTDPDDRRQVVVTATPEAEALLERFRELNLRQLRDLLSRLDSDELAIVDRSLAILHRAIDRAASAASGDAGSPASSSKPSPKSETRP